MYPRNAFNCTLKYLTERPRAQSAISSSESVCHLLLNLQPKNIKTCPQTNMTRKYLTNMICSYFWDSSSLKVDLTVDGVVWKQLILGFYSTARMIRTCLGSLLEGGERMLVAWSTWFHYWGSPTPFPPTSQHSLAVKPVSIPSRTWSRDKILSLNWMNESHRQRAAVKHI